MNGTRTILMAFLARGVPALLAIALPAVLLLPTTSRGGANGKAVVDTLCAGCHLSGVLNAPKLGDAAAWAPRIKQGEEVLVRHALEGFNSMPPRGGNPALTEEEIRDAVAHMVSLVTDAPAEEKRAAATEAKESPPAPPEKAPKASEVPNRPARVLDTEAPAAHKVAAGPVAVNRFNRLMRPPSARHPEPARDGIHDPANTGTPLLQHPQEAFASLEPGHSGNDVDWVKSLEENRIEPRYDRLDPARQPVVLDLNIVREVKGSMPNVVYPHKQHTEWLDCSNCHPAIFIPKKGANALSMASILLGEQCGVCHGKVAFPVSECRRCHSQNK